MKCRANNNAIISSNTCIKRQELSKKMLEDDLPLGKFRSCLECKAGLMVKKFPFKRYDNDVKDIIKRHGKSK